MSSSRLPGKVLRSAAGRPMLAYVIERVKRARNGKQVVVATSEDTDDDAVFDFCRQQSIHCVRGPLENVAARFGQVLDETGADAFVRVSGDSPLIDPAIIDRALRLFEQTGAELATNVQQRTFPKGMSVEVIDAQAFRKVLDRPMSAEDREHVTAVFYRRPQEWRIAAFTNDRNFGIKNLSVDTADDFARFESILARMIKPHWSYGMNEVLALDALQERTGA